MKLNKEQIQEIEDFLDYKELHYIDIRIDVIDHMAEDIEKKMEEGTIFNEAFQLNKRLWKKDLELDSSYLIGYMHSAPKIVIDNLLKTYKKWLLFFLLLSFLFSILYRTVSNIEISKQLLSYVIILSIFIIISQFYMYIHMRKIKTTYLFLFKKTTLLSGFVIFLNFLNPNISFLTFIIISLYTVFGFSLFSKHQKVAIQ